MQRSGGFNRLVKRVVKGMSEIKYNTASNAANVAVNLFYSTLITPTFAQGTNKSQRIGNKIKYKMLTLNFNFWSALVNAAQQDYFPTMFRILVFQTRTAVGSPMVDTDFFDTSANYLSTVKGTAVRVMYDELFVLTPTGDANQIGCNSQAIVKSLHFPLNNEVTFRDSTSTVPTDVKDNYYLVVYTNYSGGVNTNLNIQGNWYSRISFYDI